MSEARKIVSRVCNEHRNSDLRADNRAITTAIDEALAAARREERERCAKVVEAHHCADCQHGDEEHIDGSCLEVAAAAIRGLELAMEKAREVRII